MIRGIGRWDVALAAALMLNGQYEAWGPADLTMAHVVGPAWVNAVGFAVVALALLWRRRAPLAVVAVVAAVIVTLSLSVGASQGLALFLPLLAALYAVGRYAEAKVERLGGLLVGAAAVAVHDFADPLVTEVDNVLVTFWLILLAGWVIGDAFRRRHDRSLRDERSRAVAAVAEERARIARELHDVIAHSLGLVTVQAVAALDALEIAPERARRPLETIESTARQALGEMRRLVSVMREDDSDREPTDVSLEALVARLRDASVPATLEMNGSMRELPPGLQLTLYRIVQEAVTNACKHAPGAPVDIAVTITDAQVDVTVRNDAASPPAATPAAGSGYGLLGIRERVAVYGGRLDALPTRGGGFAVHVTIPVLA